MSLRKFDSWPIRISPDARAYRAYCAYSESNLGTLGTIGTGAETNSSALCADVVRFCLERLSSTTTSAAVLKSNTSPDAKMRTSAIRFCGDHRRNDLYAYVRERSGLETIQKCRNLSEKGAA